jgi:S1-C subfamily serine protease
MKTELINKVSENTVRIDVIVNKVKGNGTGLIIDDKGTVLTCEHVVRPEGRDADSIKVVKGDTVYDAKIAKINSSYDIAILHVDSLTGNVDFAKYDEVHVGEDCLIVGYPLCLPHQSVSKGIISAKGKRLGTQFPFDLFEIDARINYGNSGGPVFQASTGRVIGIVTAKYIPFLTDVDELRNFLKNVPQAPSNQGVSIMGINIGPFFNFVNESIRRISGSLMLVQVGIGWVIPIQMFFDEMKE